jgi:uncharacterized membrane protein YedE/YeeE
MAAEMTATAFTPLAALLGGAMIGAAAVVLLATTGRIAGISGFIARLLPPYGDDGRSARLAFILGIIAAPLAAAIISGAAPVPRIAADAPTLVIAGLLVGFGAVWGNGCTSGHGVCGLARLSARSAVATAVFMATAIATVFLTRHLL